MDITRYNGPWDQSENLEQSKFQLSYLQNLGDGQIRLEVQGYDGEWDSTDQIPTRAVRSGLIDELGFIDPDLGGSTERYALTASIDVADWAITAYAVDYDFALYSNFTYFLEDPVFGDEFEQRDARRVYGFNIENERELNIDERPLVVRYGLQTRIDDIDALGLYQTQRRVRRGVLRADSVEQRSAGLYAAAEFNVTERLRAIAGLRGDYFDWDVSASLAENSGSGDDTIYSPKLSLAYQFNVAVEGYANWGRGFHSNDVRGTTITVDPLSGDAIDAAEALVASEGAEIGIRVERAKRFNASLVAFWLELDSELVFVGDAGGTEASSGSRRTGIETSLFWQANDWLALDANYTVTDAKFREDDGAGDEIPGAVESTASLGFSAMWNNGVRASARLRYLGHAPLI